ncbi:MAG TPA: Asp-tRNA(Asn)/Glu-tRNA(Gln) amidotransferase subunit GatB [Gemmatimonadaceae bacterium]|nr:Asp-tRNA(Asn)/Glu-tRNA(Gln) amidotransferase subunit GatB [Gemmatimonadaceae bacterium]
MTTAPRPELAALTPEESAARIEKWEMVVGLEVHVQLLTRTKAFCPCSTEFGAAPNTNVCPVCLALPGALPVLNEQAVELAIRAALALGCTVQETSVFARKNYFYPDLPKGYQISQYDQPLATGGRLVMGEDEDGAELVVGITRVHLEEDAGKSLHDRYAGATAVDLNRAGVPLIEIVSEPDLRSSAEAGAYLRLLKQLLEYVRVSDVSMEQGSLRVDANLSVRRRGEAKLGTKTEVKNMNSFAAVERALASEYDRQISVLESGGTVQQQTMLWDGARARVRPSRAKEGSDDYRYFPDPDLLPLVVDGSWVDRVERDMPELPAARRERMATEYALARADVAVLTATPELAEYFECVARAAGDGKAAANWVMGDVLAAVNARGQSLGTFPVRPDDLGTLIGMVRDGVVSRTAAKSVFTGMLETGRPPAQVATDAGLLQVGADDQLTQWIDDVLSENPREAERFAAGERKLQGVLVGLVMKKSAGRADPKRVNQLLASRAQQLK